MSQRLVSYWGTTAYPVQRILPKQPAGWCCRVLSRRPAVVLLLLLLLSGKDKIRLYGIDAPEKTQSCTDAKGQTYSCGQASTQALQQKVGKNALRCEVSARRHPARKRPARLATAVHCSMYGSQGEQAGPREAGGGSKDAVMRCSRMHLSPRLVWCMQRPSCIRWLRSQWTQLRLWHGSSCAPQPKRTRNIHCWFGVPRAQGCLLSMLHQRCSPPVAVPVCTRPPAADVRYLLKQPLCCSSCCCCCRSLCCR